MNNMDSKDLSTSTGEKNNDDIDLMALVLVLLRGWKIIALMAILGLLLGLLYTRYVNPIYKSDALIQIEENTQGIEALGESISELVGAEVSKAETEAELIRSRMILEPVVELLHLRIKLTDPNIGHLDRIKSNRTYTQLNTPDDVSLDTENGIVKVRQFDVSPAYLNQPFTLTKSATGFVLSNGFDEFKGQLGQAHQFKGLDGQINITVTELPADGYPINIGKQTIKAATDAINSALSVEEKGQKTGIIQLSMTGPNQEQITTILNQIVRSYVDQNQSRGSEETTKTLAFMETQIPLLKEKLETSEALFNDFRKKYGTIDVGKEAELLLNEKSRIDEQLNELKLKKADLTTYYTEEHPLVIQINEQLKVLNNRTREIDNTIAGLPEIQREFLKLSEDTAINREIYLTLLKNYEQLKIVKAGQIGYARIIDSPTSTFNAIAPNKLQILMLTTLIGMMFGVMLVLLKNLVRNVVKDPEHLEVTTGIPVIATIPRSPLLSRLSKKKNTTPRMLAHVDHSSLSYEAIKSLRTNLMFGMPMGTAVGQLAQVILITGESPGVGKSFIAANLSEVFAQLNKKVLVIDGDMRLGELHKMFNMSQHDGLADYLLQDKKHFSPIDGTRSDSEVLSLGVESFIHSTGMELIDFIPRGRQPHNPTSLLMGEKFNHLMAELKTQYDYIVIDSPPILAASDAMVLAQHADKVLIVTKFNHSIEGQLVYAIKQMNKANVQVDGIILNDVQQGLMDKYSYHYHYAYGDNR
ncbi:polysaccharide biosynthesis tyrosine autokinase [Psychrobacter sp.]|uniref:polysaccharide biosynthesis tyrosine autokinase n=1 Tax=Psychrobacter sp. TaxID=56811 RepID=UPI000B420D7D|nr:polysaccharide biosynthesis tyrosine autokinase [Psychrobacter sp.]